MANTLNGMITDNIAQIGFSAFTAALAPLNVFSTDFSSDLLIQGNTVNTRIVPVSGDAVDLQTGGASGDREHPSVIEDINTDLVTVTLDQEPIKGFSFTDQEVDEIQAGVFSRTIMDIITHKAYAVAKSVLDFTFNLITLANYGAAIATIPASSWDSDDVTDLASALKKVNGWNLNEETFLIQDPDYIGALQKDGSIKDVSASGFNVLMEGDQAIKNQRVGNFTLIEAATLPPAGGQPATENLTGFVSKPSAIAIAMRATRSQAVEDLIDYQVMVDPITGVIMVFRVWHARGTGRVYYTFETKFGASVGQSEALKRIVSS